MTEEKSPAIFLPVGAVDPEFMTAVNKIRAIGFENNQDIPKQSIYAHLLEIGARAFLNGIASINTNDLVIKGQLLKEIRINGNQ
jgi:hypothetical protein